MILSDSGSLLYDVEKPENMLQKESFLLLATLENMLEIGEWEGVFVTLQKEGVWCRITS